MIATVSMAVVSDFRDWRIPNRLIAVGMIQGFLMSAVVRGPCDGLLSSVAGCVIPMVILFVLFHKKALGAGDIKLLATAGTFVGTDVIRVIVYSFLAGGVISLFFLLKEVLMSVTNRKEISTKQFYRNLMKSRVHFSAAIMGGVMYYVCTTEWR
nr:prepilin peptidase [Coprococcus eutactus]